MTETTEYRKEIKRKSIHLISTIIPVIYYYTSKEFIVWLVGTGLVLMFAIDIFKAHNNIISRLYKILFHDILRSHEKEYSKNYFTGGTYYAAGIFLSLVIFPMEIAVISILVLIWCDTMAALTGMKFGRIRLYGKKTLEGTLAFNATGILICFYMNYLFPGFGFISAGIPAILVTSLFELFNNKLNDNLVIPVFNGLIFTLLKYII